MIYYIKRRKFIAKVTADLGKTIFAVGLASYFFERFSHRLKIAPWLICIILIIGSFFIHPEDKTGE
jgi:hypothetical protein